MLVLHILCNGWVIVNLWLKGPSKIVVKRLGFFSPSRLGRESPPYAMVSSLTTVRSVQRSRSSSSTSTASWRREILQYVVSPPWGSNKVRITTPPTSTGSVYSLCPVLFIVNCYDVPLAIRLIKYSHKQGIINQPLVCNHLL